MFVILAIFAAIRRDLRLTLRPMAVTAIPVIGTISMATNANCILMINNRIRNVTILSGSTNAR